MQPCTIPEVIPLSQTASALPRRTRLIAMLLGACALAVAVPAPVRAEIPQAADAAAFAEIKIGGEMSSFQLDNGLEVVVISGQARARRHPHDLVQGRCGRRAGRHVGNCPFPRTP